ncbi:hypothetical protein [Aquimarina algiphila]|uniref:hypothetical protein n=1 Tax=Aquimarina algiphila TaxID=2047982 RepID=UPI0023315370|nr:hypothetical protein [Aquimarina algiphila]
MKKIVIVFGLFFTMFVYSQQSENVDDNKKHHNIGINDNDTFIILSGFVRPITKKLGEKEIKGSKYYEEDFKLAVIYDGDKVIHKSPIKYNAFNDEIEVLEDDKEFALLKKEGIKVVLDSYQYVMLKNKGYFIIFNKNKKTSLVLKPKKKFRKGAEAESTYSQVIPPSFIDNFEYYIKTKEGELEKIKLKKKNVLAVLKDKKTEIEKFASSKKLSFKKEEDLVKIIEYYSSL